MSNPRHVLVCGATSGIGRASALRFAREGMKVSALARSAEALEALTAELSEAGAPAAYGLALDLEDLEGLEVAITAHLESEGPLEVLINNSGGPPGGPLLEATPADFTKAFTRHLFASHLLVRLLLPGMEAAGFGRIVNVISTSVREPIANLGVSNTTRGAMASWAKTLSKELPPCVTINSILPGFTDTPRLTSLAAGLAEKRGTSPEQVRATWLAGVPVGRLGRPEETASAIAYLCGEDAGYVRGQALAVDGGRLNSI